MIKKLLSAMVFLGNTLLIAQTGSLKGRAIDKENAEGVAFASVYLEQKGVTVLKSVADIDGNYELPYVSPGVYDLVIKSIGYESGEINSVRVESGKETRRNINMNFSTIVIACYDVIEYAEPLIDPECIIRCGYRVCCGLSCITSCTFGMTVEDSAIAERKIEEPVVVACKAYPNPFIDQVTFELSKVPDPNDIPTVKLYDLTGKEVRSTGFSGTVAKIERESLSAGTYMYRVVDEENSIAEGKLVLQR